MRAEIIRVKGTDVQVGDIFNNRMVTYRQQCSNCIGVTFHDDSRAYFLFSADVLIRRPALMKAVNDANH